MQSAIRPLFSRLFGHEVLAYIRTSLYSCAMPYRTLTLDRSVDVLRAIGEPTRARIVHVLRHGECSVTDLCDVLGQSQPRISRHLRLLLDADVCTRHREGNYAFFSLRSAANDIDSVLDALTSSLDPADPVLAADLSRLKAVRERRSEAAHRHFAELAQRWDRERSLLTPDAMVEAEINDLLTDSGASTELGNVIDVGTGTGRMIELLASAADRIVGLDANPAMLRVARANLDRAGIHHAELRQSDIFATPPFGDGFDLAVIHQVLHFLDDPHRAIAATAELLTSTGRILIVDLPRHAVETMRTEHAHRRLGFTTDQIEGWFHSCGLEPIDHRLVRSMNPDTGTIGVGLWLARKVAP